jgi:hypothetical protein
MPNSVWVVAAQTMGSRATATPAAARRLNARTKPDAPDRVLLAQVIHQRAPTLRVVLSRHPIRLVHCGKTATATVAAVRLAFASSQTVLFARLPTASAISTTRVTVRPRTAQRGSARPPTSATRRMTTVAINRRAPVRQLAALLDRCVPARTFVVRSPALGATLPIAATASHTTAPTPSNRVASSVVPIRQIATWPRCATASL